tara:strand:- start:996 stop:1931 length:936 start_codon:yes stop_codon:yes gene_type:complete
LNLFKVKFLKPKFWQNNNLTSLFLWPLSLITLTINIVKKLQTPYVPKISTICVGNIYLGGTGKTELVVRINQMLKNKYSTYVIKKNYKNQLDEQILLKKNTKLFLPRKRLDGLKKIETSKKNIAIFDDGLQDKSIEHTLSIVCFNSLTGVGNGRLLPSGPLRESLSELANYNAIFINGKKNNKLIRQIKIINKKIKIFSGKYFLKNKKNFSKNSDYLAFCGIGTPQSFFNLLSENNIKIKKKIVFPDHYDYGISDIERIKQIADLNNYKIVTTEKDYVKIKKFKKLKASFVKIELIIDNLSSFKKYIYLNI